MPSIVPFPSEHTLRAALRVAQLIDERGSSVSKARTSYTLYASDALYAPSDLREGERLLLSVGLLMEESGTLSLTERMRQVVRLEPNAEAVLVLIDLVVESRAAASLGGDAIEEHLADLLGEVIPDPDRREARLIQLGTRYDSTAQSAIGGVGEDFVVRLAQERLEEIGRPDLASGVRRVSLLSDLLGYDVVVPTPAGRLRLEVKTSTRPTTETFRFFISRNEIEWGANDVDWRLVACRIVDGQVSLVGFCSALQLLESLPVDSSDACWRQAEVTVGDCVLQPGFPSLV